MFNIKKLTDTQKILREKIIDISYHRKLSHLGSCLSVIDILLAIYEVKKDRDKVVLSCGHAGVALYAVLEYKKLMKIEQMKEFDIHPDRNSSLGIDVSTGSLGQGLPIAMGLALAHKNKNVYCVISDGECTEGSIWESFRIAEENKIENLTIIVNTNGWGAYSNINTHKLFQRIHAFLPITQRVNGHNIKKLKEVVLNIKQNTQEIPTVIFADTTVEQFPFLKGQNAHYYIMNHRDYKMVQSLLAI